jgi:hypothetical protein
MKFLPVLLAIVVLLLGCASQSIPTTPNVTPPQAVPANVTNHTNDSDPLNQIIALNITISQNVTFAFNDSQNASQTSSSANRPQDDSALLNISASQNSTPAFNNSQDTNQTYSSAIESKNVSAPPNGADAIATISICQVIYDPPGKEPDEEMIKLCNQGSSSVDIGGWILTDEEGRYAIPSGTTIQPFDSWGVYGSTYNPARSTRGLYLANNGDCVILLDGNSKKVDSFCW